MANFNVQNGKHQCQIWLTLHYQPAAVVVNLGSGLLRYIPVKLHVNLHGFSVLVHDKIRTRWLGIRLCTSGPLCENFTFRDLQCENFTGSRRAWNVQLKVWHLNYFPEQAFKQTFRDLQGTDWQCFNVCFKLAHIKCFDNLEKLTMNTHIIDWLSIFTDKCVYLRYK